MSHVSREAADVSAKIYKAFLAAHPIKLVCSDRENLRRRIKVRQEIALLVQDAIDEYVENQCVFRFGTCSTCRHRHGIGHGINNCLIGLGAWLGDHVCEKGGWQADRRIGMSERRQSVERRV